MAEGNDKKEELIIKKIKKGGGGHHGGAWKVAYADFVTAMMAFFLLLWLLSTTTPVQRQGIAEYFTPTTGLKDARGIGFEGGLTPNEKGTSRNSLTPPGLVVGQVEQGPIPKPPVPKETTATNQGETETETESQSQEKTAADEPKEESSTKSENDDEENFKKVTEGIKDALDKTSEMEQFKDRIIITNTPEGLKIDLVDDDERPMFNPGSAVMTDAGRLMLKAVGGIITRTPNHLAVRGHVEQLPYPTGATYTGWELSADRANSARRFLSQNVVEPDRVSRVGGMGDRELLLPNEPSAARNRRISLILLRNDYMTKDGPGSGRGLLSVPDVDPAALTEGGAAQGMAQ